MALCIISMLTSSGIIHSAQIEMTLSNISCMTEILLLDIQFKPSQLLFEMTRSFCEHILRITDHLLMSYISALFSLSICCPGGFWTPYATYVFISLIYASVAGGLVSFVEPLAAGSGIAEIKTYLNGVHIKGLLTVGLLNGCFCSIDTDSTQLNTRPNFISLIIHQIKLQSDHSRQDDGHRA